jgi:DNA-binding YbaB/EbfC family protein
MTDFKDLLSQAKQMKEKMESVKTQLKQMEVEGVAGGSMIKVVMTGDGDLKKVLFDDKILSEKKEIIEDLIVAAHNDAKNKLKKKTSEEMSKVTGGISLPPGFKLPL